MPIAKGDLNVMQIHTQQRLLDRTVLWRLLLCHNKIIRLLRPFHQ